LIDEGTIADELATGDAVGSNITLENNGATVADEITIGVVDEGTITDELPTGDAVGSTLILEVKRVTIGITEDVTGVEVGLGIYPYSYEPMHAMTPSHGQNQTVKLDPF
jgi:hypothetical protein